MDDYSRRAKEKVISIALFSRTLVESVDKSQQRQQKTLSRRVNRARLVFLKEKDRVDSLRAHCQQSALLAPSRFQVLRQTSSRSSGTTGL